MSYTCPSGYSLSDSTCRAQSNSATTATSDRTLSFVYGPEHQRVMQRVTLTGNAPSSMMGGTTWYLHGDNNSLLYEKEVKANGVTEQRHYVQAAGITFALAVLRTGTGISSTASDRRMRPTQVEYFQQDNLGSIAAITDENGAVIERLDYDPWGKRRYPNGLNDKADSLVGMNTDRGYTLHEHLDEVGVIHMNGRVYDPLIGRFMSADPFIQSPGNLQSYNRYAYVMNNPLALTDPSGYFSFKQFLRVAVVVGVAYFTGGAAAAWYESAAAATTLGGGTAFTIAGGISGTAAIVGGAAGGFAAGFTSSTLNGGGLNQSLQAGLQSGFTGALFGAAGGIGEANSYARYAAHAGAGCVSSVASGGNCGQGAASGVFGKFATNQLGGVGRDTPIGEVIAKGIAASVAGGVGSVIAGGKFENGATTAAFGYLFNYCAHNGCFDRRFDWNDAVDQWRNGNGSTVTDVKASELNLTDATYTKNADGSYQIHTSIKYDTGAIYGTVTGVLNADGSMSIKPDTYNFDIKWSQGASFRNFATAVGAVVNGFGKRYDIQFTGSIPAPQGLPR